ncbi:MAG: hypothetical protein RLZZ414_1109 [Bacteroidota bacterium]|jgi:hypothetical protein
MQQQFMNILTNWLQEKPSSKRSIKITTNSSNFKEFLIYFESNQNLLNSDPFQTFIQSQDNPENINGDINRLRDYIQRLPQD